MSGGDKAKDESTKIPPGSAALLAAAIATDRTKDDPVASSRAELFLDEQTKLIRLQTAQLDEQRRLLLASLRFRHAGEMMGVTLQVMLGLVGLVVVLALGADIWSATHDNGLVVEAFDVPPDLAARGLTGKVVASQLLDRLSELQDQTASARAPNTYKNNWGDDVKVQIPNTGISIEELNRYLRDWLGHETHIGGEVFHTATGIAVTARAGGASGRTFEGPESDLGKLLQRAAEDTYARTQPYRYSVFLDDRAQYDRGAQVLQKLVSDGPTSELKWAHVGLANTVDGAGDFARGAAETHAAIALDPNFSLAYYDLSLAESLRGHDEQALAAINSGVPLFAPDRNADLTQRAADMLAATMRAHQDEELGDFLSAARDDAMAASLPDYKGRARQAEIASVADLAFAHDAGGSDTARRNLGASQNGDFFPLARATLVQPAVLGRWTAAGASARKTLDTLQGYFGPDMAARSPRVAHFVAAFVPCALQPWVSLVAAHSGAMKTARMLIDGTPTDCYLALRMRGKIDALTKNWAGAAQWFGAAVRNSPSIPFAYADWGEMLLAKGDTDGAIAELVTASQKGPHFADPLELWGEALMRENRSDLARAKFSAANEYAPNWARLHLKWGEALFYAGEKEAARTQFAVAAALDLSDAEKSELAHAAE